VRAGPFPQGRRLVQLAPGGLEQSHGFAGGFFTLKIRNIEAKNQVFPDCDLCCPHLIWTRVEEFFSSCALPGIKTFSWAYFISGKNVNEKN
jgi:hypothetical protein